MGDHYLQKSYSFQSENDVFTEQFRVDSPSWGIEFTILPLNDDPQYCWFVMNVTNVDTGQSESYGYGRENGYELTHRSQCTLRSVQDRYEWEPSQGRCGCREEKPLM